jgi:hypothetical protein
MSAFVRGLAGAECLARPTTKSGHQSLARKAISSGDFSFAKHRDYLEFIFEFRSSAVS